MFAVNKNSYLQSQTTINPRIINRSVDLARDNPTLDQFDEFIPFNRLTSEQPHIPALQCDVTRRPLAFGRRTMAKLRHELHSKYKLVVMHAINSISDLVHDPEMNYEAIKLRVPARLVDLLVDEDPAVRERVCITLTTMCNLLDGKFAVVKNQSLLRNIFKAIEDDELAVRYHAIVLVERLAHVWMSADYLVDFGFIHLIVTKLQDYSSDRPCLYMYLRTLESLMYCNGKQIALDCGLFKILAHILKKVDDPDIIGATLKDLSIMMQLPEGKMKSLRCNLLPLFNVCLHDDNPVIYENAACAMVYATVKSEAVLKAVNIPGLFERLFVLAKNHHELPTQRYCLQTLTNMAAQRTIKKEFMDNRMDEIRSIYVARDEQAERIKHILLYDVLRII